MKRLQEIMKTSNVSVFDITLFGVTVLTSTFVVYIMWSIANI